MNPVNAAVDHRYSVDGIAPTPWSDVEREFAAAEIYALTTLLPDGMPHTVPVSGLLGERGFCFTTAAHEEKVKNIASDARASVHIGSQKFFEGIDIVIRGRVERITDAATLKWMSDSFIEKYGDFWTFTVGEDALINAHGWPAWCFVIIADVAYGFTRGDITAQTRYDFA